MYLVTTIAWLSYYANFMNAVMEKNLEADTWTNFTHLPQNVLRILELAHEGYSQL